MVVAAMPICVPGQWRVRESHPAVQAYESPVEPAPTRELQAPVSNRAHRPYESQLGTCRACNVSVTTGRVELPSLKGTTF